MSSIFEFVELYHDGAKVCELRLYVQINYENSYFKIYDKNEVDGIKKYMENGFAYIDRSIAFCHCYRACLEFARKELGDAKN